jgi:diguanylate cyclase (GGDEF)-like protein
MFIDGVRGKPMNLRIKLPILIVVIVSASILISGIITYFYSSELLLRKSDDEMKANAYRMGEAIRGLVSAEIRQTEILASQQLFRHTLAARSESGVHFFDSTNPQLSLSTKALQDAYHGSVLHEKFWLGDSEGVVIAGSDAAPETGQIIVKDRSYFIAAMKGAPAVSGTIASRANSQTIIVIAVPVKEPSGQVIGVVGNSIYTSFFSDQLKGIKINKHGVLYIVDAHGMILAHSANDNLIQTKVKSEEIISVIRDQSDEMNGGMVISNGQGSKYLAYSKIPLADWTVIVEDDVADIQSPLIDLAYKYAMVLLLSITAAFGLFVMILFRWVTKPLHEIIRVIMRAGAGDLTARVQLRAKDEFRVLGTSLNDMLIRIGELMQAQETANRLQLENVAERERSRVSELLRTCMYKLNSTLDAEQVKDLAFYELLKLVRYDRAASWMLESDRLVPHAETDHGIGLSQRDPLEVKAWFAQMRQDHQPIMVCSTDGQGYLLAVPLEMHGKLVGLHIIERKEPAFERSEVELVLSFCSQAVIAVTNAQLYREKEMMAITDELTGIYNRRHFFHLAQQWLERAELHGEPISVILYDVDYFKQVNDRFGHLFGDLVLRNVPLVVAPHLPPQHLMARYGGEEFVLLLPGHRGAEAWKVAEAMRRIVADHSFEPEQLPIHITASLGAAENVRGEGLRSLLQRADQALYEAKRSGRNCTVLAEPSESMERHS